MQTIAKVDIAVFHCQLLMHEPGDVPQMKDRGVAVSPGLYSYIALETTEVTNLPLITLIAKIFSRYGFDNVTGIVTEILHQEFRNSCDNRAAFLI